jgi:hypothetical protein
MLGLLALKSWARALFIVTWFCGTLSDLLDPSWVSLEVSVVRTFANFSEFTNGALFALLCLGRIECIGAVRPGGNVE